MHITPTRRSVEIETLDTYHDYRQMYLDIEVRTDDEVQGACVMVGVRDSNLGTSDALHGSVRGMVDVWTVDPDDWQNVEPEDREEFLDEHHDLLLEHYYRQRDAHLEMF